MAEQQLDRLDLTPRRRSVERRAATIVGGRDRRSLEGVDRDELFEAVRAGLLNDDGRARESIGSVYKQLSFEDLEPIMPEIHQAILEPAPSGIMFADGVRSNGLKLLARHNVEEGIDACVHYVRHMKQHGSQKRVPQILDILKGYGAHGKRTIPRLLEIADFFEKEERNFPKKLSLQKAEAVRAAAREIEAMEDRPTLIRIGK